MARTHINFRTGAALILLGALVVLFASLGNWQLNRAAQRDAIHDEILHAAEIPPVTLTAHTPHADLIAWRRAQAHGQWLHQYTVLLENRNYQTRPGYWVATPLQLTPAQNTSTRAAAANDASGDGTDASDRVGDIPGNGDDARGDARDGAGVHHAPTVLVLRGWLARDDITQSADSGAAHIDPALGHELARATGDFTVSGQLFPHVPRLFELWSWSDSDETQLPDQLTNTQNDLPTVQNLDLTDYARATGLKLLPIVLAETSPDSSMVQDWPHPSSDSDTNRGYALQWLSFCIIAAGAFLFIAWRTLRRPRRSPK